MSIFLYNLFLKLYQLGIRLAALKDSKAAKWADGRKDIFENISAILKENDGRRIWIHCASLGEFEQGRPVMEAIKKSNAENRKSKVVLTFFSPSGYEIRRDDEHADYVFYLPVDGKQHAERFINLIHPSLVIFVKYEFWYHYLHTLYQRNIPTFLISATFRSSQPFFKWYGSLFRKMLGFYSHLFLQDETSKRLLNDIGITNVTVAGDTRYDRVADIAAQAKEFPLIEEWKKDDKILIAGSTWREDEKLLRAAMDDLPADWKIIVAPHEIHEAHLHEVIELFENKIVRYSQLSASAGNEKVLLIDNIGMLSSIYRYGDIAYIGGGLGSGIHNILEAAIYGLPALFGPNYKRFFEACEMVDHGFAFSVANKMELKNCTLSLFEENNRSELRKKITSYMQEKLGATDVIINYLQRTVQT